VIESAKNRRVHTTDVLETLQLALDAMVDQETGVRGYLISGDEKFLDPIIAAAMPTPQRSGR
jgi:CHASE3 domain sensor protein